MSFEHASTIRPCADTPARKDSRKLVDVAHKRTNTVPFQRDRDKPARTHGGGLLDKAVRIAGYAPISREVVHSQGARSTRHPYPA